jgi:class 3 adenylate cyclase
MDTNPPLSVRQGQRALAAIIFTDVVGFSARMQADEETSLRLLERDFAVMREMCSRHEGSVLKTTGDGLLLYFTSAVQAVACALAMQRHFAEDARRLPPAETLAHRLGIHLGDVFVSEQDVMGDGVNIASRLQAEAAPGGICISQTVYDVVKNKLALQVINLGPRELKNIAQAMPVYRILLEAQALGASGAKPRPSFWRRAAFHRPSRRHLLVGGIVAGVLAAAAVATGVISRLRQRPPRTNVLATVSQMISAAAEAGVIDPEHLNRRDIALQVRWLLEKYDFDGLARYWRTQGAETASQPAAQTMQRAAENLAAMKNWLATTLRNYTRQEPLTVTDLSNDAGRSFSIYVAPDSQMHFVEGGADLARAWPEVKPAVMGSIIISALRHAAVPPPRAAALGAQSFARLYHLPQMQEVLRTGGQRK